MIIRQCHSVVFVALFCIIFLASCASNPGAPNSAKNSTSDALSERAFKNIVSKGDEALSSGSFSDAQVQYALAIKEQPNNIELLYKLAIVHYEENSFDVSRDLLETIIDKDVEHLGAYEMLGLIALKDENITLAEKYLEKALALDINRWRSQNAMGIVKDMQSMHVEAQLHFKQALLSALDKAQIENNLGYSYYLDGNYSQAENHYRNATQINPDYEKAWANLGLLYVRNMQYEDARYAFRKLVDDHIVSNNLGFLSMLQGDNEMARQELSRALLLAPTYYPKASENLTSLDTNRKFADSGALGKLGKPVVQGVNKPTEKDKVPEAMLNAGVKGNNVAVNVAQANAATKSDESSINSAPQIIIMESAFTSSANTDALQKAKQRQRELGNNLNRQYLELLGHRISDSENSFYNSVLSFQATHLLEPTGELDSKSTELLTKQAGKRVRAILASLNYDISTSSEILDEDSVEQLRQFQRNNSLRVSGKIDRDTLLLITSYLSGGEIVSNAY